MTTDEACWWTMPTGRYDTRPVTLDGLDAVELAELLAFTADALGWRGADVIRADLVAHLRRWATRLHPLGPPGTPPGRRDGDLRSPPRGQSLTA